MSCIWGGRNRVIRGPDWTYKNQDGGRGHAGTVLNRWGSQQPYSPPNTIMVQWDCGDKGLYRIGYNKAFDLRFLELASTCADRHHKVWCDGCNMEQIRGIRWRCTECYAIDLCTACYMSDKHDLSHAFARVVSSMKTSKGVKVLPRSSSSHIPLKGSFPGAMVARYPQWCKKNKKDRQIGRVSKIGQRTANLSLGQTLVEFNSGRERVEVTDIICMLPGSGGHVYEGHLQNYGEVQFVDEGDKVLIAVTPEEMQVLHERRGLWDPDMIKTCGRKGYVTKRTDAGNVKVTFDDIQETFTMNVAAVRKLHRFSLGQDVRISDDVETVKRLQVGHGGWKKSMEKAISVVGKVIKVKESHIHVKIQDKTFVFNSANLAPTTNVPRRKPKEKSFEEFLMNVAQDIQKPETMISLAVASHNIPAVEDLLKEHPEWIRHEPTIGKSLISVACDDVDMMKVLVEKGAFIESYDEQGCTPLFYATTANNFDGVRYLLEQGANVDSANFEGLTSFMVACENGSFECAHYLLMHGADVNLKSKDDCLPVIRAIGSKGRTILDLILARKEVDLKATSSSSCMTAMSCAARSGNIYALTKLIEAAPKMVDVKQCNGNTPIFNAVLANSLKATEVLVKKGHCNVNVQNFDQGYCPLHLAIVKENFALIEVLVKNGADANIPNCDGDTCLQMAMDALDDIECEDRHVDEVPFMAEMKKKWGHVGIKTNGDALLAYLVSHGADLDANNCEDLTIRESCTLEDDLLQALDKIQSITRKDISRLQSTADRPLRSLTKVSPNTDTENGSGLKSSLTTKMQQQSARRPSDQISVSSARPGSKRFSPNNPAKKSSVGPARPEAETQHAKASSEKPTSRLKPSVKTQNGWTSPENLSGSMSRQDAKMLSAKTSSENSSRSSARPDAQTKSARTSSEKSSTGWTRPGAKTKNAWTSSGNFRESSARPGVQTNTGRTFSEKSSTAPKASSDNFSRSSARPGAQVKSSRLSSEKSSTSWERPGAKMQSVWASPETESTMSWQEQGRKTQSARTSAQKVSVGSDRPETKTQNTRSFPDRSSTTPLPTGAQKSSARNASWRSSISSGSHQKSAGKSLTNGWKRGAGDNDAQKSQDKPTDTGERGQLEAELQRKDDQLKALRSKVKTLEHLVKKKISFACGHDIIRSIAELIPNCPECRNPIASVADA
ncbi:E3 ubiquitin-protein ligase MIB2-like [Lytechinus variegatus]|uniref:E3 ubiquitin-protein ligase MIB2-like n=1 Tax=Lytechinus variegatus TaxID=7654 RepID=UPI001BB0DB98|nr:E3 ubiquitin-protein ligase MIB2-like [Lytechinus variegatus]